MLDQHRECLRQVKPSVLDTHRILSNKITGQHGSIDSTSLNLESVSSHAGLVLLDQGLALLRGVIGFREQHAVIPGGLLGLTDAAGLEMEWSGRFFRKLAQCAQPRTLGFSVGSCWAGVGPGVCSAAPGE